MALDYRHEALPEKWPGEHRTVWDRKRDPFKTTWAGVDKLLERELRHLGADNVVIALDVASARDLRFDGKLRADARPVSPRVILSFTDADGMRYHYPCDTYSDWLGNLNAIAHTLENLRAVERYGVSSGRQYAGFRALGAGDGNGHGPNGGAPKMTAEEAAQILAEYSDFSVRLIVNEREVAAAAHEKAKRRAHPDAGGTNEAFVRVAAAAEVLTAHHGAL